jgi:hypothetical protein
VTTPRDIVKRISQEAKRQGQTFEFDREGANHSVWLLNGSTMIPIPRHRQVGEQLTEKIYKEFQDMLGTGWWRS